MKLFTFVSTLLLLTQLSFAADTALTQELYKESGLKEQVKLLAPTMKAQINQAKQQDVSLQKLPNDFMKKIDGIIDSSFQEKKLEKVLINHLNQRMSARDMKEVLAWYKTPTGKKSVQVEIEASAVDAMQEMMTYMQTLRNQPLSQNRTQLLNKFSNSLGFNERGKALAIDMSTVMLLAFMNSMPAEQRPSIFTVRNQVKTQMEQNKAQFDQMTFITFAYTYHKLSDKEINNYIRFAQSSAGKSFIRASFEALSSAITQGMKSI